MATKNNGSVKKSTKKSTDTSKKATAQKPAAKQTNRTKSKSNSARAKEIARQKAEAELAARRTQKIKALAVIGFSFLFFLLYAIPGEKIPHALHQCIWGMFGFLGFAAPAIAVYCAAQYIRQKPAYRFKLKASFMVITVVMFATIFFSFGSMGRDLIDYGSELMSCFRDGTEYNGTGFMGGLLGIPFTKLFGSVGAGILSLVLFGLSAWISFEALFVNFIDRIKEPVNDKIHEQKEIRNRVREQENIIKKEKKAQYQEEYIQKKVDQKVTAKKKNIESKYRRINKTPFYEPDNVGTKVEHIKKPPKETVHSVVPEIKEKKPKKKTKIPSSAKDIDYVREEPPIFAENLNIASMFSKKSKPSENSETIPSVFDDMTVSKPKKSKEKIMDLASDIPIADSEPEIVAPQSVREPVVPDPVVPSVMPSPSVKKAKEEVSSFNTTANHQSPEIIENEYIKPPFTLLEPQPEDEEENIAMELQHNGKTLVDTLKSFGVQTTIINISRGPSVTRYELQPAAGVKISKITNLSDDIAMGLAATGVRIEAPIPGKSAVGIEVPNKHVSIVKMRNLLESSAFQDAKSKLTVALGMDITGKITLADLAKMPHLLIAGSTGSGKSVCINSMLVSLLYKSSPDEVKLMLIDPKVVELGVYNGIPHLLVPVVTDPRKAAGALNWAVNEMLERYKTFAEYGVRDMQGYNRMVDKQNAEILESDYDEDERSFEEDEMLAQAQSEVAENGQTERKPLQKMPQIVIVIDELADLMMAAPNEVEESICRLAQMARAAGMHLLIATQRPSVDVITGLIKANIPSRIAFAVKSQIDSRTILDTGGAEKLLGRGDMLFAPIGKTKPIRVQGCFVDDYEIENIISFIKSNKAVEYDKNVIEEIEKNAIAENNNSKSADTADKDQDPMMEQAIKCVVEAGQASTSLLQRRLRLGYARAGRLIDEMEQMGIVGPHEGSKPRQVLMSYQQWLERNMSISDNEE